MNLIHIGTIPPDFTQNDPNGKPITLSGFRGKYLLIDFWASWCGPCRRENPNVVKAYDKYRDKGFEVLGVSLDSEKGRDNWINDIKEDGLVWTQVSDLKYWKNAVAVQFGIHSIPQNFLLDPTGKIVDMNLRGEELNKKLAEIFKM
jgi:peroxiredoxin